HARHSAHVPHVLDDCRGWMPELHTMRAEQHHAVAVVTVVVVEAPRAMGIKAHDRVEPPGAVEIGPLIGEPQGHFDDATADALHVRHAGVAGEMACNPVAAIALESSAPRGFDEPVVEGAFAERNAARMPEPHGTAIQDGDVRADVLALQ